MQNTQVGKYKGFIVFCNKIFYKFWKTSLLDRGHLDKASATWITQIGIVELEIWPKQDFRVSAISKCVHVSKVKFYCITVIFTIF